MKAKLAVAGVLILTACGYVPGTNPSINPGPSSAPVSKAGVSSPSSTPTRAAIAAPTSQPTTLPPGDICRIPYSEISEASGGFIDYPSGQKVPDPSSEVALPGNNPGAIGVNPGLTYIASVNRWVPAPRVWVAPSGSFYLYADNGGIHGVTIADGQGVTVVSGSWSILGVTDSGVYATQNGALGVFRIGFGASPQQLAGGAGWLVYHDGGLWRVDPAGNLTRHDVTTSLDAKWGQVNEVNSIAGFDSDGNPIIYAGGELIIHHPDATTVQVWPGTNGLSAAGYVFSNPAGTFFSVGGGLVGAPGHGVYRWTASDGAKLISANEVNVMGPCEAPPTPA